MIVFGTDFDDTLYFHNGEGIREEDVKAIKDFQNNGNQFGLVSGRGRAMWSQIEDMVQDRVKFDFRIFSNGACICDGQNRVLKETFMPENVVRELYEKYADAGLTFHGQDLMYMTQPRINIPGIVISSIDEMDPSKIYAVSYDHEKPEGKRVYEENLGRKDVTMVSNSRFTDFISNEASKGKGLNYIAHELYGGNDISAAIGDSFNDQSMLEDADVSFTFPTSPKQVQDAATYVVDGISEAIPILLGQ